MDDIASPSGSADSRAVEAVKAHHAEMAGELAHLVEKVVIAVASGEDPSPLRADLVTWCRHDLVPHALAEEKSMYPAAHALTEGRLLVTSMLGEHTVITDLVSQVDSPIDDVRAAAAATALRVMFDSHLRKENELILPLLAGNPDVSVAALLGDMRELLGHTSR